MKFKKTFIIFLICILLLNISIIYANNVQADNELFFRIHIVANSDTIDDQILKYKVAKEVNDYITLLTKDSSSKDESKKIIEENMQYILKLCNTTIKENGKDYVVKSYLGKLMYDEKQFNSFYMNEGIYDSLKIVIGDGKGQNWWSLIYPTTFNEKNIEDLNSEETTYSFFIVDLIHKIFK